MNLFLYKRKHTECFSSWYTKINLCFYLYPKIKHLIIKYKVIENLMFMKKPKYLLNISPFQTLQSHGFPKIKNLIQKQSVNEIVRLHK